MSNMSYCRMQNTFEDLKDCYNYWDSIDVNNEKEKHFQKRLLDLCKRIVDAFGEDIDEDINEDGIEKE